jgi:hypothetical protein
MDYDQSLVVPEISIPFNNFDYNYYNENNVAGVDKYTPLRNAVAAVPQAVVQIVGQSYVVTSPGIYSSGHKLDYKYDGIEFLEAGKYSFRHMCTFTKPAVASRSQYPAVYLPESAGYKSVNANYYNSYVDPTYIDYLVNDKGAVMALGKKFSTHLPVHLAKRDPEAGLAIPEYRKKVNLQLDYLFGLKVEEKIEVAPEPEDDSCLIGGRYIPFIHFQAENGYVETISPNKDWTKTYKDQIPHLKPSTGYFSSYIWSYHPAVRTFDESTNQVVMSFLDTKTNTFVYDMYLDHCMTMRIREAGRAWFEDNVRNAYVKKVDGTNVWEAAFFDQLTGYEYNKKLNNHFVDKGFPSFKCPYSYHIAKDIKWWESTVTTREVTKRHEMVPGYYIAIDYKGNKVVGWRGEQSGFITCADDEKMTVLETAWCQRVVAWNYTLVTDQKYMTWDLIDWLIGPFAEKIGATFAEAPMIFAGKKAVSRETKANILAKLAKGANANF